MRRLIYRHTSDKGSVIEFDMFGTEMRLLVLDAKYRPNDAQFGMYDEKIEGLNGFECWSSVPKNATDEELQAKFAELSKDLTATKNTDVLMRYELDTDFTHGTDAASACRKLGCELPNMYELMVIFQEAQRLNDLDPTVEYYPDKALFAHSDSYVVSSTIADDCDANVLDSDGEFTTLPRCYDLTIVPVHELRAREDNRKIFDTALSLIKNIRSENYDNELHNTDLDNFNSALAYIDRAMKMYKKHLLQTNEM